MTTPNLSYGLVRVADAEGLRAHLDALNEAGKDFRAAGTDARGEPFLIALDGPYAEVEVVIHGSPWDSEVDYGTGRRCEECHAANLQDMGSLSFPVTILTPYALVRT